MTNVTTQVLTIILAIMHSVNRAATVGAVAAIMPLRESDSRSLRLSLIVAVKALDNQMNLATETVSFMVRPAVVVYFYRYRWAESIVHNALLLVLLFRLDLVAHTTN
jgi:hypothetical protein